ncbi:MAG: N-acetylneuraminate synthase [Planctomycetes bacterium]|nr:N-acetylneuraminate synthase [Planctomycetota bacterium]
MPEKVFIIAEAGVNHNGDVAIARKLVDAAVKANADAVKFQTFVTEELIVPDAPKAGYQIETTGASESQFQMLKKLELSKDAHFELKSYCDTIGIEFMSTPFHESAADLLEEVGVRRYKIASSEITNLPLLRYVARKGKPIIMSTGMATIAEVEDAVRAIRKVGDNAVSLMHCVSCYPSKPEDANLQVIRTLAYAFGLPVGFSDHSEGIELSLAAVCFGATIIEKHFTLDKTMDGPDHRASLSPDELHGLVRCIRNISVAFGTGIKTPTETEIENARVARKSIVAAKRIEKGAAIEGKDLLMKRPGTGLPAKCIEFVIGRTSNREIDAGELILFDMLE